MKKFKNFMLVLLTFLCVTGTAWGADFYVDYLNGHDAAPGDGTNNHPWQTISKAMQAVDAANAECTVYVYTGIYNETVTVPSGYIVHFIGRFGITRIGSTSGSIVLNTDVTFSDFIAEGTGTGITVNPGGIIQDAIGFAYVGGTINVTAGTYAEHITVNKALTLTGASNTTTFIDGSDTGTPVQITANSVTMSGFGVQNSGRTVADAGIILGSIPGTGVTGCDINNNQLITDVNGIVLAFGSSNTIENNTFDANGAYSVMVIASTNNTITTNTITDNATSGIYLDNAGDFGGSVTSGSTGNLITYNTITGTLGGECINLGENCDGNTVSYNTITDGSYGIHVWKSDNNDINHNTITFITTQPGSSSAVAIRLRFAQNNSITYNTITDNMKGFEIVANDQPSLSNTINYNNISDNGSGMDASQNAMNVVDAQHNWWGDISGPYHSTNPCGTGNSVTDYVDFDPWASNVGLTAERSVPVIPTIVGTIPAFCESENRTLGYLRTTYISGETGATFRWYATNVSTTALSNDLVFATGTYYVNQTTSYGCVTARIPVAVVVSHTPEAPGGNIAQSFCSNDHKKISDIVITTETGATTNWYNLPTGGTEYTTPGTTELVNGTTYYVSQNNPCVSTTRRAITVSITQTPGAPGVVDPHLAYCSAQGKIFTNLVTDAGITGVPTATISWWTLGTGGTEVTGTIPVGTNTYYAEQTLNGCPGSARTAVAVTVTQTPGAPSVGDPHLAYCSAQGKAVANLVTDAGISGVPTATINWWTLATGGTEVTGTLPVGTYTYYAEQTLNGCVGTGRTGVAITVTQTPGAPTATEDEVSYCTAQAKTLANLVSDLTVAGVAGSSIIWYDEADAPFTGTLPVGTYTLYAEQTLNGCVGSARLAVDVTVSNTPVAPVEAIDKTFCEGVSHKVSDLVPYGTGYTWYNSADEELAGSVVLESGNYHVTETAGICEGPATTIAVTIITAPEAPTTSTTLSFCFSTSPKLEDIVLAGETDATFTWYTTSTGSEVLPTSTALPVGTHTYYASQTSYITGCESVDRLEVEVTVNDPAPPTATSPQTFCYVNLKTVDDLAVSGVGEAELTYYVAATGTDHYEVTDVLVTGHYYVSQTVGGCESGRTAISVIVNATDPGAPSDQDYKLQATNIRADRATIGWTRGNGEGSFVVASLTPIEAIDLPASCNDDHYTGFSNNFNTAAAYTMPQGSSDARIVYFGNAKVFAMTGLVKYTVYYLKVCAYKTVGGVRLFNTLPRTPYSNSISFRTPAKKEGDLGTDALAGTFSLGLISPNPVTDAVNFTLDVPQDEAFTIEIYDLDGKLVNNFCQDLTYSIGIHNININTSNLSSGAYTLVVKTGADMAITQFVVAK